MKNNILHTLIKKLIYSSLNRGLRMIKAITHGENICIYFFLLFTIDKVKTIKIQSLISFNKSPIYLSTFNYHWIKLMYIKNINMINIWTNQQKIHVAAVVALMMVDLEMVMAQLEQQADHNHYQSCLLQQNCKSLVPKDPLATE